MDSEHSTWKKEQNPYSTNQGNYYYDDIHAGGGYNHLETRRLRRLYDEGPNKKGDLAKPMDDARWWVQQFVTNPGN